ncbi:thioredoxin family protein [uncultured Draconibacterium sp.]|uniref:thioredoxin family protein n=1 Tax=uncultured Draconibacterium sp. TaxID=1573823 RepID=UPI0029C6364C|nr:thioredoxin family protein [uncultured Draconibacterium sp.]
MKKTFLLLVLIVLVLPSIGQGVNFEDITIEQAIEQAKAKDKYVFVDVYTNWCGPCKMMDEQLFPLKEVGDYFNTHFISVKKNAEVGEEGPRFANKYGIRAYPTFVIFDKNGELIHMFAGGILDLTFIDKVDVAFDESKAYGALKRRVESGEKDPRVVASYLEALMNTYTTDVSKQVDEFYTTLNDEDKLLKECLFMFDLIARLGSEREQYLRAHVNEFRKAIGTEKIDEMYRTKYRDYFGKIIQGYGGDVTKEDLDDASKKIAELNLADLGFIPPLQKAALVKITETGKDDLLELIKTTAPDLGSNEKDIMLYFIIPGLQDQLDDNEEAELVNLVSDESTKGTISRSLRR